MPSRDTTAGSAVGGGKTTRATTVIVERYRAASAVSLAHARCADSQVIEIDADFPSRPDTDAFSDMTAKLAVLAYQIAPRFRPLLVLEPRIETSVPTESGEQVNLWMSGLLEFGLSLMRTGGQMPGRADGWRLQFLDQDQAQLLDQDGDTVYIGECSPPGDWLDVVSEIGGCVVLIGSVGLYAVADQDMTVRRFARMLDRAARTGVLAGGLVVVR